MTNINYELLQLLIKIKSLIEFEEEIINDQLGIRSLNYEIDMPDEYYELCKVIDVNTD